MTITVEEALANPEAFADKVADTALGFIQQFT
jgi:hypothetical protein